MWVNFSIVDCTVYLTIPIYLTIWPCHKCEIKSHNDILLYHNSSFIFESRQPYHPAGQDRLPTEAKQGWAGQYLDGRPPGKTRLLWEVLVRPAGGAHPVFCVDPNALV